MRIPEFSVVIPTHNRAALLRETVESVLAQDFGEYETIVVDDGSTDGTPEVIRSFGNRVRGFSRSKQGPERSRNYGASVSKGKYIVYLDSDDLLLPYALSIYHGIVERVTPALILAKGKGFGPLPEKRESNNENVRNAGYEVFKDLLSKRRSIWLSTSFLVVEGSIVRSGKVSFKSGTFPVDDLDFILRAGTAGPCVLMDAPVTVKYRIHGGNSIHETGRNIEKCRLILELERRGEYPGGNGRLLDRYALIGGHIQCWARKGLKEGMYPESLRLLLIDGALPVMAAFARKLLGTAAVVIAWLRKKVSH